ncbi:hypothetical protein [Sphingomonas sp.]|uniref:hypothetical protein n=1 Tax=Sphingomonas sp. TaxID=28214 RepID=UPI003CC6C7AC
MRVAALFLLALCAISCAPKPQAALVRPSPPPAAPHAIAPPLLPADWREWPQTPGTWRYTADARGSVAMFGRVGSDAVAVLRCDRRGGRLFLSVAGSEPATLTVRTSSVTRTLPVGATDGMPPYLAATLTPADPLLDAMAFSRGRFVLSLAEARGGPLVLPAWAEVGRVVEDCRA